MNNPFFDQWLTRLREAVRTNAIAQLEEDINDIGLDALLDDDFFEHAQQADARELVILLASLGAENTANPAPYLRWLAAYQCLQGRIEVNEAARACVQASGGQAGYYKALLDALPPDSPAPDVRRTPASVDDLRFGMALLVLAQQSHKLLPLLKAWQTLDETARPWLLACRTVLKRLDQKRTRSESVRLASTLELLLTIAPAGQNGVVQSVEAKLADTALQAQQGALAMRSAERLLAQEQSPNARFLHTRALIQTGDLSAALEEGDALLCDLANEHITLPADSAAKPRFNIGQALDTLETVTRLLEAKGLQPFLMSGTLLGFERNGTIMAHDKDIDLGLIGWEHQFTVAEALLESGHFYMDLSTLKGHRNHLTYAVDMRNGMAIDFFFFHDKGDHYQHGIEFDFGFTLNYRFSKFDLVQRDYGGKTHWVPSDIPKNLSENYGAWEVPESNYVVTVESPGIAHPGGPEHRLCVQLELIKAVRERLPAPRVKRILDHLQAQAIPALSPKTTDAVRAWAEKYSAPKSSRLKDMLAKIRAKAVIPEAVSKPLNQHGPKLLLVGHSFGNDGAALMLKKAARYWTQQLGWTLEGYAPTSDHDEDMLAHGIAPVRELAVTDHHMVLFNSLLVADKVLQLDTKLPKVLWVHEGEKLLSNRNWNHKTWSHLFKAFDALVFQTRWQSETVFGKFLQNTPAEKVHLVPNGIDWPFGSTGTAQLVAPLAPDETLKVVCVASLTERKRPHDLAAAVLAIAKIRPVQCTFIGDVSRINTLPDDFQALFHQGHPALRFTGPLSQDEIAKELKQSHVFCLPSGDESYPLAPLEAALSGVPVVLSGLAPYPHIGWTHGTNCLSFAVGDTGALQTQLLRLADEPGLAQRLGTSAHQLATGMTFENFCQNISANLTALLPARSKDVRAEPAETLS